MQYLKLLMIHDLVGLGASSILKKYRTRQTWQCQQLNWPFSVFSFPRPKTLPDQIAWAEEPRTSLNCPRQNGYFGHKDPKVCDTFYYCVDGMFNKITCPAGLVFNSRTGICTWPDEAQKAGCSSEGEFVAFLFIAAVVWSTKMQLALPCVPFGSNHHSKCRSQSLEASFGSQISMTLFVYCSHTPTSPPLKFDFYRWISESRIVPVHLPESWRGHSGHTPTLRWSGWLPILLCVHQRRTAPAQWLQTGPSIRRGHETLRLGTQDSRMVMHYLALIFRETIESTENRLFSIVHSENDIHCASIGLFRLQCRLVQGPIDRQTIGWARESADNHNGAA